jgi:hypothetical protein
MPWPEDGVVAAGTAGFCDAEALTADAQAGVTGSPPTPCVEQPEPLPVVPVAAMLWPASTAPPHAAAAVAITKAPTVARIVDIARRTVRVAASPAYRRIQSISAPHLAATETVIVPSPLRYQQTRIRTNIFGLAVREMRCYHLLSTIRSVAVLKNRASFTPQKCSKATTAHRATSVTYVSCTSQDVQSEATSIRVSSLAWIRAWSTPKCGG